MYVIVYIWLNFQSTGLGKLKPNTLVLGFKTNWSQSSPEGIEDYIHTIL